MLYLDQQKILLVESALETPAFAQAKRKSRGAKGRGLRYEDSAQRYLKSLYGDMYVAGPWFKYKVSGYGKWLFAQPDGLLFDFYKQRLVIVEMKYNHCVEAYQQLFGKYRPLMKMFLNSEEELWEISCCEVVYWYDRDTAYPEPVVLRKHVHEAKPTEMVCHIWRPK